MIGEIISLETVDNIRGCPEINHRLTKFGCHVNHDVSLGLPKVNKSVLPYSCVYSCQKLAMSKSKINVVCHSLFISDTKGYSSPTHKYTHEIAAPRVSLSSAKEIGLDKVE